MECEIPPQREPSFLTRNDFPRLVEALISQGYRVLGPGVQNEVLVWREIADVHELPVGWRDHQQPGQYRLEHTDSGQFFDIVHGPESLKRETFAPRESLLVIERTKKSFSTRPILPEPPRTAMLGVRACDLAGLTIQDQIFMKDLYKDPYYQARRETLFLIAVNCTRSLETCFCASMGTGPKAQSGYDLVLTESDEGFVIAAGSTAGQEMMETLPLSPVPEERRISDEDRIAACGASQTRRVDPTRLPQALYDAHDHPGWDEVANRCLACTNCTMVCPTCFCHAVEEKPDLTQERSEHTRVWDSCFTADHGYIHGKNFRPTIKDRYRMWLTHKMASWIDQFGMSGCVGCGRCITWCPVGIDLTEELYVLLGKEEKT